jgi:acyl dehydratase
MAAAHASNPRLGFGALRVGQHHERVVVESLSRTQIVQYAGASGDFNPIHHDETFATKAAGYPTVFAHGMLSMALTGTLLTDWLGDGVLLSFGVRFRAQVWPGDTLTARATVAAIEPEGEHARVRLELETVNQRGEAVVVGDAVARLPQAV